MMTRMYKYSAIALLMTGVSSAAMALDTADLKVTGKIGAPVCSVALGGSGSIDYGRIAISALNPTATLDTPLPVKSLAVTVTCDVDTSINLKFRDNRASSAGGNTVATANRSAGGLGYGVGAGKGAGLGLDSSGKKVGGYSAVVSGFKVDNVDTPAIPVDGKGREYSSGLAHLLLDSSYNYSSESEFHFAQLGSTSDMVGKVFTFDYKVQANIAPKNNLDLTKEITLDGSVAMEVKYL